MKKIISVLLICVFFVGATVSSFAAARVDVLPAGIQMAQKDPGPELIFPGRATSSSSPLSIFDVTAVQRHLAEIEPVAEPLTKNADFDGDGAITVFDATNMQRKLADMSYQCIVTADPSYLSGELAENSGEQGDTTDQMPVDLEAYNEICMDIGTFGHFPTENMTYQPVQAAVITSREQYFSFLEAYTLAFDDDFFQDNALLVVLRNDYLYNNVNTVESASIEDGRLCVNVKIVREKDPFELISLDATYCLIAKVSRADIAAVNSVTVATHIEEV